MERAPRAAAPFGVSVVICCHNSSRRLPETLAHLAAQHVRGRLAWEVVVVDNASTDGTAETAKAGWPAGASAPLRVVAEPRAGLSHARQRGLMESRYEIVSFIDDDNWVCPEWVRLVAEVMEGNPGVGACGGPGEAVCEVAPPAWFDSYRKCYAVGTQCPEPGPITELWTTLWGAGLTLRRSAWNLLFDRGFQLRLAGRQGAALTAGEDSELSYALRLAGWELWYDPRLRFRHYLPEGRLRWGYLRRMNRGFGAGSVGLDPYEFALRRQASPSKERVRRTWSWQALRTLKRLAGYQHKLVCWSRSPLEGDPDAIVMERLVGRWKALLQQAGSYDRSVREVLNAPWAQPPSVAKARLPRADAELGVEQVSAV
jgi:glycosyltransferase involved in cell wall biosynthesis